MYQLANLEKTSVSAAKCIFAYNNAPRPIRTVYKHLSCSPLSYQSYPPRVKNIEEYNRRREEEECFFNAFRMGLMDDCLADHFGCL
jgi:hypothetical protein